MPQTTTTHEPWCAEHIGPDVGLSQTCCTKTAYFGPEMPKRDGDLPIMQVESENDTRGSLFVQFAEDEDEAEALIEYAPNTGRLDLGALRAIRAALHDGEASELLRAIEESLAQLEAKVPA